MLEIVYFSVDIQESAERMHRNLVPRLYDIRRVPVRYQQILPLSVVRRYQCVVIGASRKGLTVGITNRNSHALLDYLQVLTRTTVFPVLIDPKRMHLLIIRIERFQRIHCFSPRAHSALQLPSQVRLILNFQRRTEG